MPTQAFATIAAHHTTKIKPLGLTSKKEPVVRLGKTPDGEDIEYIITNTGAIARQNQEIDRGAAHQIVIDEALVDAVIQRQISFEIALIEALFGGSPPSCSANEVLDNMMRWIDMLPKSTRDEVKFGLFALEFILGKSFASLSIKQRQQRIEGRIVNSTFDIVKTLGRLRSVVYSAYYQLSCSWSSIGFVEPEKRTGSGRPYTFPGYSDKRSLSPVTIDGDMECDWLIVGSGAGGAGAAAALTDKGEKVIIIEKGDYWSTADIRHDDARQYAGMYKGGGLMASNNFEIAVMQGQAVGGSSLVNNAICFRPDDKINLHPTRAQDVIDYWRREFGVRIDRQKLSDSFDYLWDKLEIGRLNQDQAGPNGQYLMDAWQAFLDQGNAKPGDLQAPVALFEKNYGKQGTSRECWGSGYCNSGCPYDRKNSVVETLLKSAQDKGAVIAANTTVRRLNIGYHLRSKPVKSVDVLQHGKTHKIRPRKGTIIAAGTAASSDLLNDLLLDDYAPGAIGQTIACNLACPVIARMPHEVNSWDGVQMGSYVDRGSHLIESWFHPPATFAASMGGWFEEYVRRMESYSCLVSLGILMPVSDMGEVNRGRFGIELKSRERSKLRGYIVDTINMHFAAGAEEAYLPSSKSITVKPGDDVKAIVEEHMQEARDFIVSTSHPQGGNIMGSSARRSVVGSDLKVRGIKNLYVADASVFPSSIRINAQMFTMAIAHSAFKKWPQ